MVLLCEINPAKRGLAAYTAESACLKRAIANLTPNRSLSNVIQGTSYGEFGMEASTIKTGI